MGRLLRHWLSLGLSGLVILPLVVVAILLATTLLPRLKAKVEADNLTLANSFSTQVRSTLFDLASEVQLLGANFSELSGSKLELQRVLDSFVSSREPFEAIYILDSRQHAVQVGLPQAKRELRSGYLGRDFSARPFVHASELSGKTTWSDTYLSASGKLGLAVAVPIGKQIFVAELNLKQIADIIRRLEAQNGVLAVIADRHGQLLAHPDQVLSLQRENWMERPLIKAGSTGSTVTGDFRLGTVDYIGTVSSIPELGWMTLLAMPKSVALSAFYTTAYSLLAVIAISLCLALTAALLLARMASNRLKEFAAHLQEVATGDYSRDFPRFRTKEFNELADYVRTMATAVLERESLLRQSEEKYRGVVESTEDLITRVDTQGQLTFVNPMSNKYFGFPPEACIGLSSFDFVHPDDRLQTMETFQHWIKGNAASLHVENRQINQSGESYRMQWNVVPDHNDQGVIVGFTCFGRDVTEIMHFNRKLAQANAQLMMLSKNREQAREAERKYIAQELHDELGQILTALRIELSALRMRFALDHPELNAGLQSVLELSDMTMQVVRTVINELRPAALDLGITPALELLVGSFQSHTGIDFVLNITPEKIMLSEQRSVGLFRIAQEALTNIARYSGATHATIGLSRQGNELTLEITDTGCGFDLSKVDYEKCHGLSGMRERTQMIGGRISIVSAVDHGTVITLTMPEHLPAEE